jgi:hypothetical protein
MAKKKLADWESSKPLKKGDIFVDEIGIAGFGKGIAVEVIKVSGKGQCYKVTVKKRDGYTGTEVTLGGKIIKGVTHFEA